MRIKSRLTPYPVLHDFGDDYIDSSFKVDYEVRTRFTEVYGKLAFELKNKDIQRLIDDDKAEYMAHIECPSTCYRTVISSSEPEIEFRLDASLVAKVVEIRTFIVLKKDVKDFSSSHFHPDYAGLKFDLNSHQIIAIGSAMNFNIQKDDRDLNSLPSILQIVKSSDKKKGSISVNTDNDDRILIGLDKDIYELYARLGKTTFRDTSFSLVLFPALVVILQRMCANKDDTDMNSRHWFRVIDSILENNGYKLQDISIDNDTLLSVCQLIFADPIARSFRELDSCSERM